MQWVGLLLHEVACRNQPSPFPGIDLDDHSGHRGDAMIGGGEAKGARRLVRAVPKAALGTILRAGRRSGGARAALVGRAKGVRDRLAGAS